MKTTLAILAVISSLWASAPARGEEPPQLWVYTPVNFQVNEAVDDLISLLKRAKTAGYSAAAVTDYKFGRLDDRPDHYYANLERTRAAAEKIGIELIPCVIPIGYSNSILMNDPNLAEGMPVRNCAFMVRDGKATVAQIDDLLAGAGVFEKGGRNRPEGWDWCDGFGTATTLDTQVKHSGASSLRMRDFAKGNEHGNCRVVKTLDVKPWHQYHISFYLRTAGMQRLDSVKCNVLTEDGRSLQFANLDLKPTADWTRQDVVFNSLGHEKVRIYFGIWSGAEGTMWIDDFTVRVAGGNNLLRREGCPVRVTSADGSVAYEEGRDFDRWVNPHTGTEPWRGEYKVVTPQPSIVIPAGSRIKDGQTLLVSYYHTATIYEGQVACCLTASELYTYLRRQIELVDKYLKPKRYFMQHDELRHAGWCELCTKDGKTAGQLLAENVRRCTDLIREVNPQAGVMTWSDMFDPHHNAVDGYYLVASTLAGSWEGLDKKVEIVNWNGGKSAESLAFFAGRGHRQVIAGYYDNDNVEREAAKWRDAASKQPGVYAWMYTTWRNDYTNLERYAKAVLAR